MRQALHIFRKDARHWWPQIAITAALSAAMVWLDPGIAPLVGDAARRQFNHGPSLLVALLPLAWWYLTICVVQDERLPGDRQYWLTRPIARGSLVAAKVLFLAAFLNLPLLLADCGVLLKNGYGPQHYVPALLCRQVILTVVYVVPAFALAALTRTLAQWILTVLGVAAGLLILTNLPPFPSIQFYIISVGGIGRPVSGEFPFELIIGLTLFFAIALPAALAAIGLQYRTRRTRWSAALLVAGNLIAWAAVLRLNEHTAFEWQTYASPPPKAAAELSVNFDARPPAPVNPRLGHTNRLLIPLKVSGLAATDDLQMIKAKITLRSQTTYRNLTTGAPERTYTVLGFASDLQKSDGGYVLSLPLWVPPAAWVDSRLEVQADLLFAILRKNPDVVIRRTAEYQSVTGDVICASPEPSGVLFCREPFQIQWSISANGAETQRPAFAFSPFPAGLGITLMEDAAVATGRTRTVSGTTYLLPDEFGDAPFQSHRIRIRASKPLGYVRRQFTAVLTHGADYWESKESTVQP